MSNSNIFIVINGANTANAVSFDAEQNYLSETYFKIFLTFSSVLNKQELDEFQADSKRIRNTAIAIWLQVDVQNKRTIQICRSLFRCCFGVRVIVSKYSLESPLLYEIA